MCGHEFSQAGAAPSRQNDVASRFIQCYIVRSHPGQFLAPADFVLIVYAVCMLTL